ncbi:unnamed protein product [Closterium sp. Naga37s-1]|nr:unnamed protein product [Closterium sp. Naga37s-1]
MASGQEKDMAREEGPTAPNEVVNNAAEIDLNQDEAMVDIELDDIEDLDLGDEDNHVEADNHGDADNDGEADNHGEEENTGEKENTSDENDFTEGEGMSYPISEEIVKLQARVSTQNITILQQQTSIDGLTRRTQNLEAALSIATKELRELRREGIYQPPPGRRPAPAAQPARAPPAPMPVGAATAMHEPPPPETTPFGSLSAPLPKFNHGKTEVEPWLDLVDTTMTLANSPVRESGSGRNSLPW